MQELRQEHFKFGTDNVAMKTTNMDLLKLKPEEKGPSASMEHAKLMKEMRVHHFSYGSTKPLYQTMTKFHFNQPNLEEK